MDTTENRLLENAAAVYRSRLFLAALIGLAVALRLAAYLANRSLWLDEAMLALNVVPRTFFELLLPLEYSQSAPIGFLLAEKLATALLGNTEYTFRLFPLLCGVASTFLFWRLARRCLDPAAVPLAVGLFAVSPYLVYYSTEAKPYIVDVAVCLLLVNMAVSDRSRQIGIGRAVLWALVGATAIWFSHPAVFMLAGLGACLLAFSFLRRDWARMGRLSSPILIWLASFAFNYVFSLELIIQNKQGKPAWEGTFVPPPTTLTALNWWVRRFFEILRDPAGLTLTGIAAALFIIGCAWLIRDRRKRFFLLIAPLAVVAAASGLHTYPFTGRLLLFAAPVLLLIVAEGAATSARHAPPWIAVVLVTLLLFHPLNIARHRLMTSSAREEIRPVMAYVKAHRQPGDALYVYDGAVPAFLYYAGRFGFKPMDYKVGISARHTWRTYAADLRKLDGGERVWVLFSHVHTLSGVDEEKLFLFYQDGMGRRRDGFQAPGASVYLYDLAAPPNQPATSAAKTPPPAASGRD